MAHILNIETSGSICSVAIANDGKLNAEAISQTENTHAAQLTTLIAQCLIETGIVMHDLDAIAVSAGPGSYTGLRIGTSTAKGICHGLNKPLIAIDTLKAMVEGASINNDPELFYCPLIDARRMDVFTGVYKADSSEILSAGPMTINHSSFKSILENNKILFFGSGLTKCIPCLQHNNSIFNTDYLHTAKSMIRTSFIRHRQKDYANVIYFEPSYLKTVYTTTPRQSS